MCCCPGLGVGAQAEVSSLWAVGFRSGVRVGEQCSAGAQQNSKLLTLPHFCETAEADIFFCQSGARVVD